VENYRSRAVDSSPRKLLVGLLAVFAFAGTSSLFGQRAAAAQVWVHCAAEGEFCNFQGTKTVRMGIGSSYKTRTLTTSSGGVTCSISVFGDAAPGVDKVCDVLDTSSSAVPGPGSPASPAPPSNWTQVAVEGGSFSISGTRAVRYGARTSWVEKSVSGAATCSSAFFGIDPLYGVNKACFAAPTAGSGGAATPPSDWIKLADEGGSFTLNGTQPVRYGAQSSWIERTLQGTGACTNAFFGADPLPGVNKFCFGPPGSTSSNPPASSDYHPTGYSLTFQDEFSGTQLNRSLWCTRLIYGGGPALQVPDSQCASNGTGTLDFLNDEQQRYVDTNRSGQTMHVVSDGVLSLRATRTRTNDSYAQYESAMIRSKRTFVPTTTRSYYLTARVRLPNVRGSWPAFWLLGDRSADGSLNWPPEIDIFEGALNEQDDTAVMLRQGSQSRGGKQTASGSQEFTFVSPNYDRTWNNYYSATSLRGVWIEVGMEWTSSGVCYFVNGYKTACENYRWVKDDGGATGAADVILNLAIGGSWAGRYGIDTSKFPTSLDIDYVRVYQK
jgi:hypothetical protein